MTYTLASSFTSIHDSSQRRSGNMRASCSKSAGYAWVKQIQQKLSPRTIYISAATRALQAIYNREWRVLIDRNRYVISVARVSGVCAVSQ